jgi:proprotein convertase subtilisin/kexin type 5
LTCFSSTTYCLTCNTITHYRTINLTSHTCPCNNGYYETSLYTPLICLACNINCLTCSVTSTNCTSCNSTHSRFLNSSSYYCMCVNGFYEISHNNPVICLACNQACLTCLASAGICTSCDLINQMRVLNSTSQTCICINGFYETSAGTPALCLSCDPICLTC